MRSALDIGFAHTSLSKVQLKRMSARKVAKAEGNTERVMTDFEATKRIGPLEMSGEGLD
jgi:hypothetical protein